MTAPRRRKPTRDQAVLTVQGKEQLSPGLVRVIAGGPGFVAFEDNGFTDKYVKILFADPRNGLEAPYDLAALREHSPEKLPVRRTYTARWVDVENQRLAIDFVVHGDEGVAGPWAVRAQPGDALVLTGAGGTYRPDPDADWHLFVGDMTAAPAIASALEELPPAARGHAIILAAPADQARLSAPSGVTVRWIAPDRGPESDPLLAALEELPWLPGTPHAFVHGERESIKRLRKHLLESREIPRERLSISAYWASGRAEDQFQAEKREPVGQLAP